MNKWMKLVMFTYMVTFCGFSLADPVEAKLGITNMIVNSPTGGAFYQRSVSKIAPGETQWVSFTLNVGNVFEKNPGAHFWFKLDGENSEGPTLQGRGIVIGDTSEVSGCEELAFERFTTVNEHPGECGDMGVGKRRKVWDDFWQSWVMTKKITTVRVSVQVNTNWVGYSVWSLGEGGEKGDLLSSGDAFTPDHLTDGEMSNIQFGLAFDKNDSWFIISDMHWGVY